MKKQVAVVFLSLVLFAASAQALDWTWQAEVVSSEQGDLHATLSLGGVEVLFRVWVKFVWQQKTLEGWKDAQVTTKQLFIPEANVTITDSFAPKSLQEYRVEIYISRDKERAQKLTTFGI